MSCSDARPFAVRLANAAATPPSATRVCRQPPYQTRAESPCGLSLAVDALERALIDVASVQGDVETALHFRGRACRISQESAELCSRGAVESLGDVVHHRDCRSFDLVRESEVAPERAALNYAVDVPGEPSGLPPCLKILEPTDERHSPPPPSVTGSPAYRLTGSRFSDYRYSHSIVAGGFDDTSYTTRFTPFTSLMMRVESRASKSPGRRVQSAVIPSRDSTTRTASTSS